MKFPLSWLKDFVDLNLSSEEIGNILTSIGIEVDHIEQLPNDALFEVSLTPNLAHCMSVSGIARELAAATNTSFQIPRLILTESNSSSIEDFISVEITNKKICPRYACRIVKNVKVAPSPEWMQKRLIDCNVRPINNIVDVTNYVLLEFGHPLHAFDLDTISGKKIIVREAIEGEHFVALDEKERLLKAQDLIISDAEKPIALAGVIGGENSEISEDTQNVLFEAAYFNPSSIRRTSKRLGLQTDASRRFERGSDPNQLQHSLNRAALLLAEIAEGEIVSGILDIQNDTFNNKAINCRLSRINSILGLQLSISEVENIFHRLTFQTEWDGIDLFTVTVPTLRVDVNEEIELIEEVARLYGYNNIIKQPPNYPSSMIPHVPIYLFEKEVRSRLIAEGLQEFITCDLIGPSTLSILGENFNSTNSQITVLNPTSIEQSILRSSLLPGLLQVVKYNYDRQNHNISGFEIGRIHFKQEEGYQEPFVVGLILTGHNHPHHWEQKPRKLNFFDLKGIIENILKELHIGEVVYKKSAFPFFHPGRQASILVGDLEIGSLGEIHPKIQRNLNISERILFAELSLQDLMQVQKKIQKMQPLPIYPASERDWTITLKASTPLKIVLDAIQRSHSLLLENVSLIDIYQGGKLSEDEKNITLRFIYRDRTKTVEQSAVDKEHNRIITEVSTLLQQNN